MTREEKEKAIDALKTSAPIMAVTQEEFKDYIQTLNKIMDWLEQEPFINKPCVSDKQCEHDKNVVLDKIRAEIDKIYEREGSSFDCLNALDELKEFIDKCKSESEKT